MATISDLYYDEGSPVPFSTLPKYWAAEAAERKMKVKPQSVGSIKAWLEEKMPIL